MNLCDRGHGEVCYCGDVCPVCQFVEDILATGPHAASMNFAGRSLADVERMHILNSLKLHGGNRERTAKALQIGQRTLYRKLKGYGVTRRFDK